MTTTKKQTIQIQLHEPLRSIISNNMFIFSFQIPKIDILRMLFYYTPIPRSYVPDQSDSFILNNLDIGVRTRLKLTNKLTNTI